MSEVESGINDENNEEKPTFSTTINNVFRSNKVEDASQKKIEHDDPAKKEVWGSKLEFIMSCLGYSVGLGAVWRFPYLCYKNGGGAFLLPFLIFIIFVGVPITLLEFCVGQFTSQGPLTCWTMSPIFRGLGIAMNVVNNYVNIYYIMILAYSFYFIVLSMRSTLPWEKCDPSWASQNCVDDFSPTVFKYDTCEEDYQIQCDNGKCFNKSEIFTNDELCSLKNQTLTTWWNPIYPSEDYWQKEVLQLSGSIDDSGTLVWQLVVALIFSWIVVLAMVIRGIKVSGKVVYFTALFPYVVLLILGIRGWMLDGAEIGITYYIKPDFEKLKDVNVWNAAAVQVFFTLSLSYGGLVTLASYNEFKNNLLRDTLILSVCNFLTCILAGFVVFAYMGFLSKQTGLAIDKVVQSGQGLAYVIYPFAASTIKGGPFWAIIFFIMMLTLGMDTMMTSVETWITSLFDLYPSLKKTNFRRYFTIVSICVVLLLLGLILCAQSGTYWIEFFDNYSGNWAIMMIAVLECISVAWFYGIKNFRKDVSAMLGEKITGHFTYRWWELCWAVISPLLLMALIIFSWVDSDPVSVGDYEFPPWTEILGNILSGGSVVGAFIWAVYMIIDARFYNKRPLKSLFFTPDKSWKPASPEHQELVDRLHNRPIDPKNYERKTDEMNLDEYYVDQNPELLA